MPALFGTVLVAAVIVASCSAPGASPSRSGSPSSTPTAIESVGPTPSTVEASLTPVTPSGPSGTPGPTPRPTAVPVPPMPTGVTFDEQAEELADGRYSITYTVTWRAPLTEGVEIRVYGVTECLAGPAHPKPGTSGPCLVEHTPLPASVRKLIATAPASDGAVGWTWTDDGGCDVGSSLMTGPDRTAYEAVVLAAYSTSRHSIFAIAAPGGWYVPGPDDIMC